MLLAIMVCVPVLANTPPTVSNIRVNQRQDGSGKVDIRYDLVDPDGDLCTVSVKVSSDGGQTWSVEAGSFSGDVGESVKPGTDRNIVWDSAVDIPGAFGTQYKVRLTADDGKLALWWQYREVSGQSFEMGDAAEVGRSDERPVHPVSVGAFMMQATDVTNEQYCEFLNSAMSERLLEVRSGVVYLKGRNIALLSTRSADAMSRILVRDGRFGVVESFESHPVVTVSWYGAAVYCNRLSQKDGFQGCYDLGTWNCDFSADGYRLPTEAEWECAARGGTAGALYPWGMEGDGKKANWFASGDKWEEGAYPQTTPVGHYPANAYGLYDMAGNVWQWCNDMYGSSFYSVSSGENPTGPVTGDKRVLRGGCWKFFATQCRVSARNSVSPGERQGDIGFRVVRGQR